MYRKQNGSYQNQTELTLRPFSVENGSVIVLSLAIYQSEILECSRTTDSWPPTRTSHVQDM